MLYTYKEMIDLYQSDFQFKKALQQILIYKKWAISPFLTITLGTPDKARNITFMFF